MRTKKQIVTEKRLDTVTEKRLDPDRPYGLSQKEGREDFYTQDDLFFDKGTLCEVTLTEEAEEAA
jgi:hypothetical protein